MSEFSQRIRRNLGGVVRLGFQPYFLLFSCTNDDYMDYLYIFFIHTAHDLILVEYHCMVFLSEISKLAKMKI